MKVNLKFKLGALFGTKTETIYGSHVVSREWKGLLILKLTETRLHFRVCVTEGGEGRLCSPPKLDRCSIEVKRDVMTSNNMNYAKTNKTLK